MTDVYSPLVWPSIMKRFDDDLVAERKRSQGRFPVREMSELLFGGAERLQRREQLRSRIQSDAVFDNKDRFVARTEQYKRGLQQVARLEEIKHELKAESGEPLTFEDEQYLRAAISEFLPTNLHDFVFLQALQGQASQAQLKQWLPFVKSKRWIGAYAQTELAHGSNVQGLQTTVTYIPETDEFEVHSPTLESTKWWSGCLGKTANHAVVFGQLVIGGKNHGFHGFLVQVRSLSDHSPLPGVEIGDCGSKWGTNANDNGYLRLDHVRIPRENMLMKHAQVAKGGEYTKPAHTKLGYGTMIGVRSGIVLASSSALAKAVTIAVRFSVQRRQFGREPDGRETQVVDYTMQQYKLFPLLAACYAFHFTGRHMVTLLASLLSGIGKGDLSALPIVHASSSGLKSFITNFTMHGIDQCRQLCGGYGYSRLSGLPDLFVDYLPMPTAEGNNHLLTHQTTRFLLKQLAAARSGAKMAGNISFFERLPALLKEKCPATTVEQFLDHEVQRQALQHRAGRLLADLAAALQSRSTGGSEPGGSFQQAWNALLPEVDAASAAYCLYTVVDSFADAVREAKSSSPALHGVLSRLCSLFALWHVETAAAADLLECGYLQAAQLRCVRAAVRRLLAELRPDVVPLSDAWNLSDADLLHSAIGAHDGRMYARLLEAAQREPLNATQVADGYQQFLRPLITGTAAKGGAIPAKL